jgi:hypothetical protein
MYPNRLERVLKTRQLTRLHLNEWGVTETFLRTARKRGASREEAAALWKNFVRQFYGQHNSTGLVILDYPAKARYWGLQFLHDNGWEAPQRVYRWERFPPRSAHPENTGWTYGPDWQGLSLRSKKGNRRLRWRLWENPNPPLDVDYGPSSADGGDDAA